MDSELQAFREAVGGRIRQRRKAHGWSQAQLGEACSPPVDQTTISRIELGMAGTVADETRLAIARALSTHPADLFAWPDRRRTA